jgi:hypothetical protein
MQASHRLGRDLLAATYAAPWAWLACFAVFVSAATCKVGHFPSYSNPHPKHVAGLCALYRRNLEVEPWKAVVYVLGASLVAAMILGNAFGLGNWLFD